MNQIYFGIIHRILVQTDAQYILIEWVSEVKGGVGMA